MLKTYTESVDNLEIVDYLESLSYEVESRKSLLGFLSEKTTVNNELFDRYFSEYQDFFIQYEFAKKDFEISYVKKKYPNATQWEISFYEKTLTVKVEEKENNNEN